MHIYDFDSTLFSSPLPNPQLWAPKLLGKIISDCAWFLDERTLHPPFVPEIPDNSYWNEDVLQSAQEALQQSDDSLVIVLTGRNRSLFSDRITLLCRSKAPFHLCLTKETKSFDGSAEFFTTIDFKFAVLNYLFDQIPTIEHVELFDDRSQHVKMFEDELNRLKEKRNLSSFTLHEIVIKEEKVMPHHLERELVHDLVKNHNNRIAACAARIEKSESDNGGTCHGLASKFKRGLSISNFRTEIVLVDHISYCALFLDESSKKVLQLKFPLPTGWVLKSDHMTVSFGAINQEFVDAMGGLDSFHFLTATHVGRLNSCVAIKIDSCNLKSENTNMHITLFISSDGNARHSNEITEWILLEEPIVLKARLDVKFTTSLKLEPGPVIVKSPVSLGELVIRHHPHLKGKEIGLVVKHVQQWMSKLFVDNLESNRASIEFFIQKLDPSLLGRSDDL